MKALRRLLVLVFVIAAVVVAYLYIQKQSATDATAAQRMVGSATYACSAGKTVAAEYYEGDIVPVQAGQPPIPNGSVKISLSDGRIVTLPQTISASGVRFANADESAIFWNKGNGVIFTENGRETVSGCIAVAKDPGGLPQTYANGTQGFSLRYPADYIVDESYRYGAMGPGMEIAGVKFTIPGAMVTGTNLSADSYISVEQIPQSTSCSADRFLDMTGNGGMSTVIEAGTTYSYGSSTGAAAGNRYEEIVYAISGTNPCIAVRYFIHYGAIENYPDGVVTEFNHAAVLSQFDSIRRTLILQQ